MLECPEERQYRWFEAAKFYEEALSNGLVADAEIAEYWERIGFCLNLGSRQAGDSKSFGRLEQLAVEAYEKAAHFHECRGSTAKALECLSIAQYNRSLVVTSVREKKKMLRQSLLLGRRAQSAFNHSGDKVGFGNICNQMALCSSDLHPIISTASGKERFIRDALNNLTQAISIFLEKEQMEKLLFAYSLSSILTVCLSEVAAQEECKSLSTMAMKFATKALQLSEKVENLYLKAMAFWAEANYTTWFEEEIEKRKSLERPEEMLKLASQVRDNYLLGTAYHHLAYALYADVQEEADPEVKKKKYEDTIEYSRRAEKHLQLVSRVSETAATFMFYTESYLSLAREFAITSNDKLSVLKKAVKVGKRGLYYGVRSGSPYALQVNLIALSRVHYYNSLLEPEKMKKRALLKRALRARKQEIVSTRTAFPSNAWYTGVGMAESAQIEAELARLEESKGQKVRLFRNAINHLEQGLTQCKRTLEFADVAAVRVRIANYEDVLGELLEEHFLLAGRKEDLLKANEIFSNAATGFSDVGLPSRAAESYWKVGGNLDRLEDCEGAAKSFENACTQYESAASKILQFSDFYLDYATYVKAWAEIERAKFAHNQGQYEVARQYYDSASMNLKKSKSWMHLALNFNAWALLEKAEDLSRSDNSKNSVEAFAESAKFFQESKQVLAEKLVETRNADEKELITRLIDVSDAREQYSKGRIAIEQAKILDREGDHWTSSEKYGCAAKIFQSLIPSSSEKIGGEAKHLFYLSLAWQKLAVAESRVSSAMFEEAAGLFKMANTYALNESSSLLALGHSSFCKALGAGADFEVNRQTTRYMEAKKQLNAAANYYLKAGYEAFSNCTWATQCLFDAYFFIDNAKKEIDPGKEAKYYLMAEKVLQVSDEFYRKAQYNTKANQVEHLLANVREEKQLALSLRDVFHAPAFTSSTAGIGTLSLIEERAVGLERFAHADIEAKVLCPDGETKVGEYMHLKVQVVNIGKEPVLLTKIDNLVPSSFQLVGKPDYSEWNNSSLLFKGKQLSPLKPDEITIVVRPFRRGQYEIKPRVTCFDQIGRELLYDLERFELRVLESVLPLRLSTGVPDVDDLLLGGIPEEYAVVLSAPSSDKRDMLVCRFLETGARKGELTYFVTEATEESRKLAAAFPSRLYLFICNPTAEIKMDNEPNVFKLCSVENLTEINISLYKALRKIDSIDTNAKRICIAILSDVLLQHHAVVTRKWLSALLPDLKSRGFTVLAVINIRMHPQEEVEAILGQFQGEIQILEKDTGNGVENIFRVKRLLNQRYLENETVMS